MCEQARVQEYREGLESFLQLWQQYSEEIFGDHRDARLDDLRAKLQRREPVVTAILVDILGGGSFPIGYGGRGVSQSDLLTSALLGGNNEMPHNFADFDPAVTSSIQRALGTLDAGLWPRQEPSPTLVVRDTELRDRCADLLSARGNYDRVIREATVILEDRIRRQVPHERLSRLIPSAPRSYPEMLETCLTCR